MKNIFYDTLKNNLCIGCGICSVVCPNDSIRMEHCDENWERPVVDGEKCVECGKCIDYCPHTFDKVRNISREIATLSDPKMFGLNNAWYYIANVRDDSARISSASGGIASYLIKKLLSQKKADVVIHGEMLKARTGELHYGAAISRTLEDVDKRKSSFYSVFSFNKVLNEIRNDKSIRRICIIGVPCIIRAIKNLIQTHSDFAHIDKVYSIALSCSHNVTGAFIDYLADSLRIDRSVPYYVNLRNKDDIPDANSYNNHFFSDEGTIVKINRFDSEFTLQWRNYSFSLNACNCCSDFWGEAADISVKDAWGKWASEDPLNRNILVVRREEINQMLLDSEDIVLEKERLSTIYDSQDITSEEKMADSRRRCKARSSRAMARINFNHRQHDKMRRLSFKLYGLMQKSGYNASLNVKAKKASDAMAKLQKKTEKNINRNKRKKWYRSLLTDHNKILVVGGYGGNNIGDEAQLDMVIKRLERCFPNANVKVMSPNVLSTMKMHHYGNVTIASRVAFFGEGLSDYYSRLSQYDKKRGLKYNITNFKYRMQFKLRQNWLYINALLIRKGLPPFLISAHAVGVLNEIRSSRLLYFEGGGYLTGATLSRLWEGMFLIKIAKLFSVPVVMSGQTIGVWGSSYDKKIAAKSLKNVNLLTLRDKDESIRDLKEIGIEQSDNVYTLCDDALFCSKDAPEEAIRRVLQKSGIAEDFIKNGYVLLCGSVTFINTREECISLWKKLRVIMDHVLERTQMNILVFATAPNEAWEMNELLRFYDNPRVAIAQQDYAFSQTRGLIAGSRLCITMKHHPIVFAMGECVPAISLSATEYFEHKNRGALGLFGLERLSVNLKNDSCEQDFINCIDELQKDRTQIIDNISKQLDIFKKLNKRFEERLIDIYDNSSSVVDRWHK